uniref:Cytochrome b n=1 Tax=Tyrophagus longior TaxID=223634 RepID=A0A0S2SXE7_TYRLO|nr:cytochrome b [Tyrophagus longior]ALP46625.1 cytochrome b [Tyrophagus longior]
MKKLNLMMSDPLVGFTKNALINLPNPCSISLLWNKGFMMSMTLVLQIMTGLDSSMNYVPSTEMAFDSVIQMMRDIDEGWVMRYLHMNGASLFFILMYVHMLRGIYFNSPMKLPMVWGSGVIILLATMGAAFMGYVLPWGQMSFWGATVITSMITAMPYLGMDVTQWLWGNFSVSQPTLNRFFSLHFLIPLVFVALALIHLILLHKTGSSNPKGTNTNYDKLKFYKYYLVKDMTYLVLFMVMMVTLCSMEPNLLGEVENFNTASMTTTPAHIQPEWYFLFAYAILRTIPSKLGGVFAMVAAIVIILVLTLKQLTMNNKLSPVKKSKFWVFLVTAVLLTWIGANPVEPPFVGIGQVLTTIYFTLAMML